MSDWLTYFITWTTYGSWLPGDARGWRHHLNGPQIPQPLLAAWCREQMKDSALILSRQQREIVDQACRRHADIRRWTLHAISSRSNHVHIVVAADKGPSVVRDQFKANATRALRAAPETLHHGRIWTKGGDCAVINGDDELERVIQYVLEAQDRMDRSS